MRRRRLLEFSGRLTQQAAGDDQLLDLLSAFENVQDLPGIGEGRSAIALDLPSDLRLCPHPFSTLSILCQRPTEQRRSRRSTSAVATKGPSHVPSQADWQDPTAGLGGGYVDVALLGLSVPLDDTFSVHPLLEEPRCVALATSHPLAHHEVLQLDQLLDEPFVAPPEESVAWRSYRVATEERAGHPIRIGAVAKRLDEWLIATANGLGIAFTPRHRLPLGRGHQWQQGRSRLAHRDGLESSARIRASLPGRGEGFT